MYNVGLKSGTRNQFRYSRAARGVSAPEWPLFWVRLTFDKGWRTRLLSREEGVCSHYVFQPSGLRECSGRASANREYVRGGFSRNASRISI
jgi:hypothetical protein